MNLSQVQPQSASFRINLNDHKVNDHYQSNLSENNIRAQSQSAQIRYIKVQSGEKINYQNKLEKNRNQNYYNIFKVNACDQNVHLSKQLASPQDKKSQQLLVIGYESAHYEDNMRSINAKPVVLKEKIDKKKGFALQDLQGQLVRSFSSVGSHLTNIRKDGSMIRVKQEIQFFNQKVNEEQEIKMDVSIGKYYYFEVDISGKDCPLNFYFVNRVNQLKRMKALLFFSFNQQFPKENTALFQFHTAHLTFCIDPSNKTFKEKTLYFSIISKRDPYSLSFKLVFGKQPLFQEDKVNTKSLTFYNALKKYHKQQSVICQQYVQNMSSLQIQQEISKFYKDKKEQLTILNQKDLIKANIQKANQASKYEQLKKVSDMGDELFNKVQTVQIKQQLFLQQKIESFQKMQENKQQKQNKRLLEEKIKQKIIKEMYHKEVQVQFQKSWLKVIYLTKIAKLINQNKLKLQQQRVNNCYHNQITCFIQRRFNQKMLTLGPNIQSRIFSQVKQMGGIVGKLMYNRSRNAAENLIQDYLRKRKCGFMFEKKCQSFLVHIIKIQKKFRIHKQTYRVHKIRVIDIIKGYLYQIFTEKQGKIEQNGLSEKRLEQKRQLLAQRLQKFKQILDRHSKLFIQLAQTYILLYKKKFIQEFLVYSAEIEQIKNAHNGEKKEVIENIIKKIDMQVPSQFNDPNLQEVLQMVEDDQQLKNMF